MKTLPTSVRNRIIEAVIDSHTYEFQRDLAATLTIDAIGNYILVPRTNGKRISTSMLTATEYVYFHLDGTISSFDSKEVFDRHKWDLRGILLEKSAEELQTYLLFPDYVELILIPEIRKSITNSDTTRLQNQAKGLEDKFNVNANIALKSSIVFQRTHRTATRPNVEFLDVRLPSGEERRVKALEVPYFLETLRKILLVEQRKQYLRDHNFVSETLRNVS